MEKIQRTSSIICKVLTILFRIVLIALIVGILLIIAETVFQATDLIEWSDVSFSFSSLSLTFAADAFPQRFAWFDLTLLLSLILDLALAIVMLRLLRNIFEPMSQGLPFAGAVSRSLRKMAFAELIFGILYAVQEFAVQFIFFRAVDLPSLIVGDKITSCKLNSTVELDFLLVFAILLLLSYVFRYGEELQRLSDETL